MRILALCCLTLAASLLAAADPIDVRISTNQGDIVVRLDPAAAPLTVENFLALAEGRKPFTDPGTGQPVQRPYYDGLGFHRVIPNFMIQGGCPRGDGKGGPGYTFADEINADGLGLGREMCVNPGGQINPRISYMQQQFVQRVIVPRVLAGGVTQDSPREVQQEAFARAVKASETMSIQSFLETLGYRYDPRLSPRHAVKGALCMANSGPGTNGSQFFINLGDTPHLDGKHTVFGQVVSGFAVVEAIGSTPRGEQDKPLSPMRINFIRRNGVTPSATAP
jgi:peptidyl-prolyl cis-trans isomerase A (cyclophilin A)